MYAINKLLRENDARLFAKLVADRGGLPEPEAIEVTDVASSAEASVDTAERKRLVATAALSPAKRHPRRRPAREEETVAARAAAVMARREQAPSAYGHHLPSMATTFLIWSPPS